MHIWNTGWTLVNRGFKFYMKSIHIQYFKHPYAEFILGAYEGQLCLCDFRYRKLRGAVDQRIQRGLNASFVEKADPILAAAEQQLTEYFLGKRREFDIPLRMVGTEFQCTVWQALLDIPYGQVATYRDLSRAIGKENAQRPVGTANGANAIAIMIPCHRIIGANGQLVGYGGGIALKKRLLELENGLF